MNIPLVCTTCQKESMEVDITEAHEYSPFVCSDCALEDAMNQVKPITVFPVAFDMEEVIRGRF